MRREETWIKPYQRKLSAQQCEIARWMLIWGMTLREVADQIDVSRTVIWRLIESDSSTADRKGSAGAKEQSKQR